MPEERAVPSTIFIAAAMSRQLRSGILIFAISSTCFRVTLPTICVPTVAAPLATPAAFLSSTEAGGDFRMKSNVRSL